MKNIILIMSLFTSFTAMAEQKEERVIELKNHVNKMTLQGNKQYRLELRESAAAYYADEKFAPCLQKSIAENKTATLKVAAYSLNILECKN
ncbi:hypothetical protein SHI21_11085 [Bacteriovorax sp. PP10]|uniref:Uncharacterized protein n=1 Tax=Bacteriovorax antarcticus TaxID=3088717 RepID=A0ABU5VUL7_9BACT|nr:hypothetical protein [Bacteriovorax sp. PP10]MEA9356754.1 hypothetical protein [Bacteriovorax sp. PP10]